LVNACGRRPLGEVPVGPILPRARSMFPRGRFRARTEGSYQQRWEPLD
jgi:hypothetical protein